MKRLLILIALAFAGCGASEEPNADKTNSDNSRLANKTNGSGLTEEQAA